MVVSQIGLGNGLLPDNTFNLTNATVSPVVSYTISLKTMALQMLKNKPLQRFLKFHI